MLGSGFKVHAVEGLCGLGLVGPHGTVGFRV